MKVTYPYPVKEIQVHDRIRMAYMEAGEGKQTLLFIHGLANYAPVWKHQFDALSKTYRCIAIDLPGNGLSSKDDYPYTLFFYAEAVKQFTDAMQLHEPILVGHSMGGQIALMLSLRYPQTYQQLVLIASAGIEYFSPQDIMLMQHMIGLGDFFYSDEMHISMAIQDSFVHPGEEAQQIIRDIKNLIDPATRNQWKQMTTASIRGMLNEQVNKFLPQISASCLLLFGDRDRFIPNPLLHAMDTPSKVGLQGAALIPTCEFHVIQGGGHFVQIEKHQEVNKHILHWLNAPKQ